MTIVYIAGPYRAGDAWARETNIRAAEELALRVARRGDVPLVPHTMFRHFDGALPDAFWLEATLELMRRCDLVVVLDTWQRSAGARGEVDEAVRLGIPIISAGDYLGGRAA
jgi:nucleoside 2-deoxyribosyltransferase